MKNIRIDNAEQPDYIPAPQIDPIGYDTGTKHSLANARSQRRAPLTGVLAGAVVAGVACVGAWRFVSYLYDTNTTLQAVVNNGMLVVALVFFLFVAFAMLMAALWLQGWATERGITLLPGGMPVHTVDILGGWRRDTARVMAAGAVQEHFNVQQTLAAQSQYRNVTSYSPSISTSTAHRQDGEQGNKAGEDTPPLRPTGDVPTFAALLEKGLIGPGPDGRSQPLIFGYDVSTNELLSGNWKQLYSTGLGGLQGSGKTWTSVFLLAQSALCGARMIIGDIHAGDSESLASRVQALAPAFVCDIADDERSVLEALKYAESVLNARKRGDSDRTPLIVTIDEFSALRRGELADKLPNIVEAFSTEGRKLNCHVMLMAQRWDKSSVGNFRNTLASSFVHRLRADEARMLTGLRAELLPKDTLQLPPGHAYLLDTYGIIHRVAIPRMSMADMQAVGERLRGGSAGGSDARPFGFQTPKPEPAREPRSEPGHAEVVREHQDDKQRLSPKAARVAALLRQKKSQNEIIAEVWGVKGKGEAWMKAAEELRGILAEIAGQLDA